MQPPQASSRASPSDFVFYHSEGDDKPIEQRSLTKKRAFDGQDAKDTSGRFPYVSDVSELLISYQLPVAVSSVPDVARRWLKPLPTKRPMSLATQSSV
jgi:hypothetical protein